MLELTIYIVAFLALSGAMALIEAAVLSISRAEVEELVVRKMLGAAALQAVTDRITRAVVVIVIFTNIINILGPILAGSKAIQLYGDPAIGVVTAVLTLGTIVFSEIIPKSVGEHYAPTISRTVAPALRLAILVLYPLVVGMEKVSSLFKSGQRRIGTETQIRSLVSIGHREGYIEADEGQLIQRAFILNDRTAADIMTPLPQMVALQDDTTIEEAGAEVLGKPYSRFPVVGTGIDDVRGLAMSRDILQALIDGRSQEPLQTIRMPCLTVPGDLRSDRLLRRFRSRRVHLAVVQDQGKTVGLVTLEDVLEELVGEIEDETDAAHGKS